MKNEVKADDWPQKFRNSKSPWFWWWREEKNRPSLLEKNWGRNNPRFRKVILGAFRYELARRSRRKKPWPVYKKADHEIRVLLAPLQTSIRLVRDGESAERTKGDDYIILPMLAFHKTMPLGKILDYIKRMLREHCEKCKIKLPKGPNVLQNRPPSWKWLELLDRKDILNEVKFADNDRAKIASARKESEEYYKQVRKHLLELHRYSSQD